MRSAFVAVPSSALDQHLCRLQRVERLAVQHLVTQLPAASLHVALSHGLPGSTKSTPSITAASSESGATVPIGVPGRRDRLLPDLRPPDAPTPAFPEEDCTSSSPVLTALPGSTYTDRSVPSEGVPRVRVCVATRGAADGEPVACRLFAAVRAERRDRSLLLQRFEALGGPTCVRHGLRRTVTWS